MGLSQALDTAVAGLRTTQAGMSLIAANVANAQTPGYVRKTLDQSATAAAGANISVSVTGVNRELDQYLQRQLRTETSGSSYADLKSQFYQQLQGLYGDPISSSSLQSVYNNFTASLQGLSTNPSDSSAQSTTVNAAQTLAQQLNQLTSGIQGLRSDAEQQLGTAVSSANEAMQQIVQINKQLAQNPPDDASTATLLDQRDGYIDQLSQLMDIRVVNGDNNQVTVFTGSGTQLVGTQAQQLTFDGRGELTAGSQWSSDPTKRNVGTISLVAANGTATDLIANNSIKSGQIASLLEMRDKILPQAQTQLDQIAASMSQSLSDQTTPGVAIAAGAQNGFDIDVSKVLPGNSVSVSYIDTATNTQHNITIVRVDDPAALPLPPSPDSNNPTIGVDFSGGMASIVNQINSQLHGVPQASTTSGTTLRFLDNGPSGAFTLNSASATATTTSLTGGTPQLPFFVDGSGAYTGATTANGSELTGFAGRISVNGALLTDPSKLVTYQLSPATTSGDATRPNFIYNQLTSTSFVLPPVNGNASPSFSGTLPGYLQQILSQQGISAANAQSLSQGQDLVTNTLKQSFNNEAGVNIDTEMSNLLVLQNAYAANARVMTTLKDMFTALMNV